MVQSKATTVEEYLAELPEDRRKTLSEVRKVIKKHLPNGYQETMGSGMITYCVPLEKYPNTYNKQPLCYVGLAAQKNHNALYLMGAYATDAQRKTLEDAFQKAGKKLDMGKSCLRFDDVDDLPLDVIGNVVASIPPDVWVEIYETSRPKKK
jgi:hypothetical protein